MTFRVVLIASGSGKLEQNLQCARARARTADFWPNFPDPDAIKTTPDVTKLIFGQSEIPYLYLRCRVYRAVYIYIYIGFNYNYNVHLV